jgi:hypothetical protein
MTPRQKRQYLEGLGKTAMAPRKSWLGKSILLTDIQSGWIKSLLTVWGNLYAAERPRPNRAAIRAGT